MAIVLTLCAAYVAYCLGTNPAGPFTTPDSIRYLEAWPMYSLGYPVFLKIVGARGAIVVQPVLFGAALAFLGSEIVKLTRSTWLAIAVLVATVALPQIREFHASILSESLFLSLLMTFLALAIGMGASASGQALIRFIVESNSDVRLINGVPLVLIAGVVATAIVVDLLGGVIFDFDVNTLYRRVFRKLDEMVAEMEELRG